jgi:hypothetical protein
MVAAYLFPGSKGDEMTGEDMLKKAWAAGMTLVYLAASVVVLTATFAVLCVVVDGAAYPMMQSGWNRIEALWDSGTAGAVTACLTVIVFAWVVTLAARWFNRVVMASFGEAPGGHAPDPHAAPATSAGHGGGHP